jgi:hypothetical protein
MRMPSGPDNKIRSIKDNPAGKVVADAEGNRWQWDSNDDTAVQLKRLDNDELAIERTDIHPRPTPPAPVAAAKPKTERAKPLAKRRDVAGGVNPYDNPGKSRRR